MNSSPQRPKLSTKTLDYVLVKGQREGDPTYASEIVFRLTHARGSSPLWPSLGARFEELSKMTGPEARQGDIARAVEQMADEAVADLINDRRILDWQSRAERVDTNTVHLEVKWRDTKGTLNTRRLNITV